MSESTTSKTLGALSAVGKVLSFIEKLIIGVVFMMLEYSRLKRTKAENKVAELETKIKVRNEHDKIDKENIGKNGADIIDDFLDTQRPGK